MPSLTLSGSWQMAIDDWLLDEVAAQRLGAVLRLYRWQRPSLSLGFHQCRWPSRWRRLAQAGQLELVRRPSGGTAVLHWGGLTYALVLPAERLGRAMTRRSSYRQCCGWLIETFSGLGEPLFFGDRPAGLSQANCFASGTAADLINGHGTKRVGSAQLWRRGHLLQHGEVLIQPPGALWRACFGVAAPRLPPLGGAEASSLNRAMLEGRLLEAARQHLLQGPALPWQPSPGQWSAIAARVPRFSLPRQDPGSPVEMG